MTTLEQVKRAVVEGTFYDYIANNYWKLSKEELKDIILELEFAMHCDLANSAHEDRILLNMCDELKDRWS